MKKLLNIVLSATLLAASLTAVAEEAKGPTLFERMGGEPVAREIVSDIWAPLRLCAFVVEVAFELPECVKRAGVGEQGVSCGRKTCPITANY